MRRLQRRSVLKFYPSRSKHLATVIPQKLAPKASFQEQPQIRQGDFPVEFYEGIGRDISSQGKPTCNLSGMTLLFGIWSTFPDSIRPCSSAKVKMRDCDSSPPGSVINKERSGAEMRRSCKWSLTCSRVIWFPVILLFFKSFSKEERDMGQLRQTPVEVENFSL